MAECDLQPLQKVYKENLAQKARHAHNAVRISLEGLIRRRFPRAHITVKHLGMFLMVYPGTFGSPGAYLIQEDGMKAYFTNLPASTWALLIVPLVAIAYPVVRIVVPAMIHAVVPQVVRTVLSLI